MTFLSVNINKWATLRNARGGNNPDIVKVALDCEKFGANGITVHPRPDERHIRSSDILPLKRNLKTDLNIEGYPDNRYLKILKEARPAQATLVPDPPNALTSNAGWDTVTHSKFLKQVIAEIKSYGIRVSVFVYPEIEMVQGAAEIGSDRIELYTESYASKYHINREEAIKPYLEVVPIALQLGLGINAGHDLDLHNLNFLSKSIPDLEEVSIGHALVCDSIYLGLENTIKSYLQKLA